MAYGCCTYYMLQTETLQRLLILTYIKDCAQGLYSTSNIFNQFNKIKSDSLNSQELKVQSGCGKAIS